MGYTALMAGRQKKRTENMAKVAEGVVMALAGPTTILPGVQADEREIVNVDWNRVDAAQVIPYSTQIDDADRDGEYRRQRMDKIILGVMRFGEHALSTIAVGLGTTLDDQIGYAVPTVSEWFFDNTDEFRDRVKHAHSVFRGRLICAVIERADKPYVPRESFRDNIPLFAALNAFVPEHFKRGVNQVNINTGDQTLEINKTLVMVGDQIMAEQKAIAERIP